MTATSDARRVGLVGYPVEHSLSPAMHNAAFEALGIPWQYVLCPVPPNGLGEAVGHLMWEGYAGWNVTVPHKERILAYLDDVSPEVRAVGACNTVLVKEGRLAGHNTDIAGFLAGLDEAGGLTAPSRALVLGAGGAARAVAWSLANAGHEVTVLARNVERVASLARSLRSSGGPASLAHGSLDAATLNGLLPGAPGAGLLVNCTPAGMWPGVEASPLPEGCLLPAHLLVYDLVYRPRPTRLLREASASGCRTQDGLAMLVHQGAAAFEIWTGMKAPVATMRQACLDALAGQ